MLGFAVRVALVALSLTSLFGWHGLVVWRELQKPNECVMTYMMPSYKPVPLPNMTHARYRLFLYREGDQAHAKVSAAAGVPVLFVPGNAGSYRQVRSVASEAARIVGQAGSRAPSAFDFWAVDFNEELSGLNGAALTKQIAFVDACVAHITSLYARSFTPRGARRATTVLLLGHSMGGVVAIASAINQPAHVSAIVTMATPHAPALVLDWAALSVYRSLWRLPDSIPLVSIGGGRRDVLIPSSLARLDWREASSQRRTYFYVDTQSIPRAHVQCDHQCIMWCNQVVQAVAQALFATLDPDTGLLYASPEQVTKALSSRLLIGDAVHELQHPPSAQRVVHAAGASTMTGGAEQCVSFAVRDEPYQVAVVATTATDARLYLRSAANNWLDATGLFRVAPALQQPLAKDALRAIAQVRPREASEVVVCSPSGRAHVQLCYDDSCAVAVQPPATSTAVTVTVSWQSATRGATAALVAVNAADGQSRLVAGVASLAPVLVRFDSSVAMRLELLLVLPADATNASISVDAAWADTLVDAVRHRLPLVLAFSLAWACAVPSLQRNPVLSAAVSVAAALASIGVASRYATAAAMLNLIVGAIPLSIAVSSIASAFVGAFYRRPNGDKRATLPVAAFAALVAAACAGSLYAGHPAMASFVVALLVPWACANRAVAEVLVTAYLHVMSLDALALFSWIRVVQESGWVYAMDDVRMSGIVWPLVMAGAASQRAAVASTRWSTFYKALAGAVLLSGSLFEQVALGALAIYIGAALGLVN